MFRKIRQDYILLIFIKLLLPAALLSGQGQKTREISAAALEDKIYASWLGQCVGNIYGLPHENRYIDVPGPDDFPLGYFDLSRLRKNNGPFSDDDTDIEYMYLLAMEKYGLEPTYGQLAESWKHHVRGKVWLANRAALAAMHYGYSPPATGFKANNPHWFQIDPQLINEIWAVTAPGMVNYAAGKSAWTARIMDDDWGVEPTMAYAAMYAAAFFERDVDSLLRAGKRALPPEGRFIKTIEYVENLYREYPQDWKSARHKVTQKYFHGEPPDTRTIWNANLNGALGIMALLYGRGDFQRTLDLACALGMDADNQAATLAGLIGLMKSSRGIPRELLFPLPDRHWEQPLNDIYKNVSRHDMPDIGLRELARRTLLQTEKMILQNGGEKWSEDGEFYYRINPDARFIAPLELPAGPPPFIVAGQSFRFPIPVSGGESPYGWGLRGGILPAGATFRNGVIEGNVSQAGLYKLRVVVKQGGTNAEREYRLLVRGKNLAPSAARVLAGVRKTNTTVRDAMWLSVPRSFYAEDLESIIRDGQTLGPGSTFYSIKEGEGARQTDLYGYEWGEEQWIGLIAYHTGTVEENGGWFQTLKAESRDEEGNWSEVEDLFLSPNLPPELPDGINPYNKPHFVEYLLAFKPVRTKAVRIIGQAGSAQHWKSKKIPFTSITELSIHGPLPGYENLRQ